MARNILHKIRMLILLLMILLTAFPSGASFERDLGKEIARAEHMVENNDMEGASGIYRSVLEDYKARKENKLMARALKWGGNISIRTGRPVDALEFYLSALKIAKQYDDKDNIEAILVNIGIVYALFRDYEQAVAYFDKALPLATAHKNNYVAALCHANLALAYSELGDLNNAKANLELQDVFPLPDDSDDRFHKFHNKGVYYRAAGNFAEDINYQRSALNAIANTDNKEYLRAGAYLEMAKAFGKLHESDSAYLYLRKSLDTAANDRAPEYLQGIYDEYARYFRISGQTDSIYKYQMLYYEVSDSQFNNGVLIASRVN